MTDTNQSEGKEEAMPTSQEQEPVPNPNETQIEAQETEEKQEVAPEEETSQEELPEGVKERTTEQFERLKAQLAEEKAKNARGDSVFNSFNGIQPQEIPQVQPQQVVQPNPFLQQPQPEEPLVDEEGTVDINRVNQSFEEAKQAEQRVLQAEQRFLRIEEDRQTQEANAAHPDLDPQDSSFNPKLFDMVSAVAAKNMLDGGNKTIKQITDEIKESFAPTPKEVKEVEKEAVENFKESQEKKQGQAPIESGKGEERQDTRSLEELKAATRAGDSSALDERLKAAGM